MQQLPKPRWEIDPGSKCPCGSALPYRKFCRPNTALIERSQEFFDKEDYPSAEPAARAELSRYIGWVFQHTLPFLRHPAGSPVELVRIDTDALEESAERLVIVPSPPSPIHTPLACSQLLEILACWLWNRSKK